MAHENLSREEHVEGSSDRTFGFVFAVAFLMVAAWPLTRGRQLRWWALGIAAAFALVAALRPRLLGALNRWWMKFGLLLGRQADKYWFADEARAISQELNLPIYATHGTAEMLAEEGIPCTPVGKGENGGLSALEVMDRGVVDLVINVPRYDSIGRPDGYRIRPHAADAGLPLITDLRLARALVEALRGGAHKRLATAAWDEITDGQA